MFFKVFLLKCCLSEISVLSTIAEFQYYSLKRNKRGKPRTDCTVKLNRWKTETPLIQKFYIIFYHNEHDILNILFAN